MFRISSCFNSFIQVEKWKSREQHHVNFESWLTDLQRAAGERGHELFPLPSSFSSLCTLVALSDGTFVFLYGIINSIRLGLKS